MGASSSAFNSDFGGFARFTDQVGKVWSPGSNTPKDSGPWDGELCNMWKPTQVKQLCGGA
jgi:hypothetical protein